MRPRQMSSLPLPLIPNAEQVDLLADKRETLKYLQWVVYLNYEKRGSMWN